ncbi:toll-like receptor 7 [Schistocerca nitens]|uniref:toll-like receptor 7 n=1 Tax=Schistocerca nitens TaxID=7011 RepID=UPI0021175EFE|nr:toll-like receptor 7 [Schistocerca nitens]
MPQKIIDPIKIRLSETRVKRQRQPARGAAHTCGQALSWLRPVKIRGSVHRGLLIVPGLSARAAAWRWRAATPPPSTAAGPHPAATATGGDRPPNADLDSSAGRRHVRASVYAVSTFLALWLASGAAAAKEPDICNYGADNGTWCRIRTLDASGPALAALQLDPYTSKLRLTCSPDLLFDSAFTTKAFSRYPQLEDLTLVSCKLRSLPPDALGGLPELKRLSINSHNGDWGPSHYLELAPGSLRGLSELQHLDLAFNNIQALPEGSFCSLTNLQSINLTCNRFTSVELAGYPPHPAPPDCLGGFDVRILDLSRNEIAVLGGDSTVTRLKRLQKLYLEYNAIGAVSGSALTGLTELRMFNISYNKLHSLPGELFATNKELREIYLHGNELRDMGPGVFHNLEQLLVLDLSQNKLTEQHINEHTFDGLIRLVVLNLSNNEISRIGGRMFKDVSFLQILDLRNNTLMYIEDNTFLPLYNLHTLNLSHNKLTSLSAATFSGLFILNSLSMSYNEIASIHHQAFSNCSGLKELDMSNNLMDSVPEALQALSFLKTLDLGENQISYFQNGSFRNLNQLTGLRLLGNNVGNLTKGMFWDLTSLQVLNLSKNKIQQIERGTFEHNYHIEAIRVDSNYLTDINGIFTSIATLVWLNLSENHLVWFDYAFIPSNLKWLDIHGNFIEALGNYYEIQDKMHIKTMDCSHNNITELNPLSIPNSIELLFINNNEITVIQPSTFADKINLVRVDMYANKILSMELDALRLPVMPENRSLPEFYMAGNPFQCDCQMDWLPKINNMTNPRQYPRVMDLSSIVCTMTYGRHGYVVNAIEAQPSNFLCSYETHCFALCHCCDFDACDCEMTCPENCTCYHDQTWAHNIVDCTGLKKTIMPPRIPMDATEVYLDGNNFDELQDHVFIGRKNLRVLFVNASNVRTIQNRTFNGLRSLEILHLEDNMIRELKGYEFERLSQLTELYLQNNRISFVANITLLPLMSLEVLRLDNNRLMTFPVWQLNLNGRLSEIWLGYNPWTCRCKFLQALQAWVSDNARKVMDGENIWCYINDTKPPQRREIDFNSTTCSDYYASVSVIQSIMISDYLPMVITTLSVFIVILTLTVVMFVFREPVRIWVYSRYGIRLFEFKSGSKQFAEEREKLYDGYVCYSPKDEDFVLHSIVAELEHGDPSFQLCLHYRDLPHQAYFQHSTSPVVLEAAEASRRVILVLSRNFMQTEWSRFEFRSALHEALKGRVFKLVVVEESSNLQEAEEDPDLRPYLKTGARVRWGEKRFWARLRYAMPNRDSYARHQHHHAKNSSMYRRNINNYTLESTMSNGNQHGNANDKNRRLQQQGLGQLVPLQQLRTSTASASSNSGDAPPSYTSRRAADDSPAASAATAGAASRPNSEHIYSSIDSDYSTLERDGSVVLRGLSRPPWRTAATAVTESGGVQAYLV